MNHKKLVKGNKYIFRMPGACTQEIVIFKHESINHFIFEGALFQHRLTINSVIQNIFEP